MSYFTILRFKKTTTLNKYLLEKCLKQYLTYHGSVYSTGINNHHKNYVSKNERIRKSQIFQNIKHTKRKVEEIIERENIWTVPNLLCMGRIITSPYLSYLILSQDYQVALWLLIIAGLSDLADGWIARTWTSQASKLGSFLDPVADKLLVGTLFFSLASVGLVPVPLTCLVISRDVALVSAASYIRYRSLPPPKTLTRYFDPTHATVQLAPTYISKINTVIQLFFVAGTLAAPIFHFVNHPMLGCLCYITALTTLAGGLSYLKSKNTYKLLSKKT
ncbi:cardiolipin synthase [Nomia melanderi]|uniref:cardiolipin synthase n=1 Tax=Nomia melanderi TaxID=2448451 RepID=UPI0013043849|nr:probable cardiolipin synthase (CMP-forming) [Nomia melanderi]XP_031833685.1 probable cardiolipin synthase (CMP-forming) [Nomia melanderi]XP_031833686.1 probable cardiolipin synthase (CMP-forming) [Nomia melanderi]XP_031833687.1 probable cardiolipin synthase (CMP-forming) [Nomia melanderi]